MPLFLWVLFCSRQSCSYWLSIYKCLRIFNILSWYSTILSRRVPFSHSLLPSSLVRSILSYLNLNQFCFQSHLSQYSDFDGWKLKKKTSKAITEIQSLVSFIVVHQLDNHNKAQLRKNNMKLILHYDDNTYVL